MTTSTSIHKVASIQLGERRYHGGSSAPFWSREIVITDDKGNTPRRSSRRILSSCDWVIYCS